MHAQDLVDHHLLQGEKRHMEEIREALYSVRGGFNFLIAGGYVLDKFFLGIQPKDIDLYVEDPESLINTWRLEATVLGEWPTAINFQIPGIDVPVQIIRRYDTIDPAEIFSQFDFTVCQVGFNNRMDLYSSKYFLTDFRGRALEIYGRHRPMTSMYRLRRYVKKGFVPTNDCLLDLAIAVRNMEQDTFVSEMEIHGS